MKKLTVAAVCLLSALPIFATTPCTTTTLFTTQQSRMDGQYGITDLQVLDYDGDNKLDIAGLIDTDNTGGSGVLHLWKGAGDGTFAAPVSQGTSSIYNMISADLNNDGRKDLIMLSTAGYQMVVRLGNGSGFNAALNTSLPFSPARVVAASLDGDAFLDLAFTSPSNDYIYIYHGVGDGTFTFVRQIASAHWPNAIAAADFDNDGRVDIAYSHRDGHNVDILYRNADGTYTTSVSLQSGQDPTVPNLDDYAADLAVADVDENGSMDLIASNWQDEGPTASVTILRNTGSHTFSRGVLVPRMTGVPGSFYRVVAADINGDGHIDILSQSINGGRLMTFHGKGDGSFYSESYFDPNNSMFGFAVADFDGDGVTDLAAGTWQNFISAKGSCATQAWLFTESPMVNVNDTAPLRALVSGISANTPLPRGTVTFREGANSLGMADIDATGYAAIEIAGLSVGIHTLTADFNGATTATSQNITQRVSNYTSSTSIVFPQGTTTTYGTPITFNVDIRGYYTQTVYDYFTLDIDGVQTRRYNYQSISKILTAGQHTITAFYRGDVYNPRSNSGPQQVTVLKATPSMANTSGALSVRLGQSHSLQFTLTGPNGVAGPSGSVTLMRGATVLASGNLSNGAVTLSPALERGAHDVTAVYSGDSNFNGVSMNLTLSVLPNQVLAIDARGLTNAVSIRAVLPGDASSIQLYRSLSGQNAWSLVNGWTPNVEYDANINRGVLYDYKVTCMSSGVGIESNVDAAMLFTDDAVVAHSTKVKRIHFDELRTAVNAMRAVAGLQPFSFDGTYSAPTIRATHLASLRTALAEARTALGMVSASYTDNAVAGTVIKALHVQELREQAR